MGEDLVHRLTEGENPFLVGMFLVAIVAILGGCVKSVVRSVTRERSRREIAAYIAEGTMTPEQGEKLMAAGGKRFGCG
jgi:hypothetical protein